MEQYKNEFLKTFDPHIVEEYKDKIFTSNEQQYTYLINNQRNIEVKMLVIVM